MKNYEILFTLLILFFSACIKEAEVLTVTAPEPIIMDSIPTVIDTTTYPKYYLVDCEYEQDVLGMSGGLNGYVSQESKSNSNLIYYSKDSLFFNPTQRVDNGILGVVDKNHVISRKSGGEVVCYFKRENNHVEFFYNYTVCSSWFIKINKGKGVIKQ